MKRAPLRQAGYTIVEVMIFLAVSAILLLSALGLFNGRVTRTEFTQSVQALNTHIVSVANEAATATFPDQPAFNCNVTPDGTGKNVPQTSTVVTGTQGTRTACIFLGKIMNFGVAGNPSRVEVYSIVGSRIATAGGKLSDNLVGPTGASPRIVAQPDITESFDIGYGTKVSGVYQKNGANQPSAITAAGFFQSLNNANNSLVSSAQNIQSWIIKDDVVPAWPKDMSSVGSIIEDDAKLTGPLTDNDILVCVKGGNNQTASITFGRNGAAASQVTIGDPQCP